MKPAEEKRHNNFPSYYTMVVEEIFANRDF